MSDNQSKQIEEGFVEFQSDAFANVRGFWNIPKDGDDSAYMNQTLRGVLLNEVKTVGGKPTQYPFYVLELTKAQTKITVQDENKVKSEQLIPVGERVGVSSTWVALKGLQRKLGHEVILTYKGRRKLANGRTSKDFGVQVSQKAIREIEPQHESEMDKDSSDDMPFA